MGLNTAFNTDLIKRIYNMHGMHRRVISLIYYNLLCIKGLRTNKLSSRDRS